MLITKYLTQVQASFNPFTRSSAKSTRIFLSLLLKESARQANATKVETTLNDSTAASLKVTYKDGKVLTIDPSAMKINDIVTLFNTHSKALILKEQAS